MNRWHSQHIYYVLQRVAAVPSIAHHLLFLKFVPSFWCNGLAQLVLHVHVLFAFCFPGRHLSFVLLVNILHEHVNAVRKGMMPYKAVTRI